mmetsp:Transcript_7629/g.11446  ORF Transcript_7629/g.11446 Transcript_7629/m.11446 type:complete len:340 (+) Transcript_7629:105-1124(+)
MSEIFKLDRVHLHAREGNLTEVKIFLLKGGSPNVRDEEGSTCLMWASWGASINIMKMLISCGANVNLKNMMGSTALHFSIQSGNLISAYLLIENKADVNSIDDNVGAPLHYVAKMGKIQLFETFLENGADVDAQNKDGMTPLHVATFHKKLNVIRALLQQKANVNKRDKEGKTPLHIACSNFFNEGIEILLEFGSDLNALDSKNQTPLMLIEMNAKGKKNIANIFSKFSDLTKETIFSSNQTLPSFAKTTSLTSSNNSNKHVHFERTESLNSDITDDFSEKSNYNRFREILNKFQSSKKISLKNGQKLNRSMKQMLSFNKLHENEPTDTTERKSVSFRL